ncbi:MAG TPA: hypothetical protein VH951_05005 [Dehalococcoidia bacterium]
MLSRTAFAAAYALLGFLAFSEVANAASDKVKVGVGVAILVVIAMGLLTVIYAIKWYFGATEPPPLPPGGLPYHSLPAGGDAHGHDAHGGGHH